MKIAMCQINTTIADFEANGRKIVSAAARAHAMGADLAVFPELAVTGYPPKDFFLRSDFISAAEKSLRAVARELSIPALVGTILPNRSRYGKPLVNAAVHISGGKARAIAKKMLMPTYDVFDESRYFEPGSEPLVIRTGGKRLGITVCEDVWNARDTGSRRAYRTDPVAMLARRGFDALINLSASPFVLGKAAVRRGLLAAIAQKYRKPVVQSNLVGGNDELLFDGNSIAIDARGRVLARGRSFSEDTIVVSPFSAAPISFRRVSRPEEAYDALVMGTRDYARKTGFHSAVLGLSGGIDSAVTACVAADALGPSNVLGVLLPGPYSSAGSVRDARALADALGIKTKLISIVPTVNTAMRTLAPVFRGMARDATEENIQARIRGLILMALSNKFGHLLLTTGNKSELSVGYCTLYGDMCGGLAVISDVPKTLVYGVGRWINRAGRVIPEAVFTKPPSAELRPNQTDQDSLPPYPALDALIDAYIERQSPPAKIAVPGISGRSALKWVRKIDAAEYKRRQAAPGLKITSRAFGAGRREPIARKI